MLVAVALLCPSFWPFTYLTVARHGVSSPPQGHKIKYVNHNKQPNAYPKVSIVNGDHRIGFYAKRDLVPGDELVMDYTYGDKNAYTPAWVDATKADLIVE